MFPCHSGNHPTEPKSYETYRFIDHRCSSFRTRRLRQGLEAGFFRSRFQKREGLQEVVLPGLQDRLEKSRGFHVKPGFFLWQESEPLPAGNVGR